MGVFGVHLLNFYPEMNEINPSTGSSVAQNQCLTSDDEPIPTVHIWNHPEDVESIKHKMKLKLGQESGMGTYVPVDRIPQAVQVYSGAKSPVGHELSMSWPNLAEPATEPNDDRGIEKTTRSSLSNIYAGNGIVTNGHSDCDNTGLSELAKLADIRRSSSDDCSSCSADHTSSSSIQSPISHLAGITQDLQITVDDTNSCLSAVLEKIPLIYIPHTKQLISVDEDRNRQCRDSNPKLHHVSTSDSYNNNISSQCEVDDVDDLYNGIEASLSHSLESGDLGNGLMCNYENGFEQDYILGQDSDASSTCRSENTVISQRGSQTKDKDSKSVEFDEVSLDRLSKVSNERDSPKNSLHRNNTFGSLSRTDASSFSSISSISTATDFSISAASCSDDFLDAKGADGEEGGFMEISLHSRNSFERSSRNSSQDSGIDEKAGGAKPKRKGFTSFLSRNIFSRKAKEHQGDSGTDSAPGWKLFGRVPLKDSPQKDPTQISEEYQLKSKTDSNMRVKKTDLEVSSTTALILEQRPQGLPSKDPEEELRHRQEYEAMVEAAKKREHREAKLRKKLLRQQLRQEQQMTNALEVWNTDILPNWDIASCTKKSRDLWWLGIPPSVRGKVWQLAIGNELNLTPELYEICLGRAKDIIKLINEAGDSDSPSESSANKESSVDLIKLDVSRTFPQLCIFQKGGPYHDLLQGLLGAYVCYRPDVGYVQGMSFIAAVLLLNMEVADAFICFSNLLNRPCQIAFFRLDESLMKSYFATYEEFFQENLPRLFAHFQKLNLTPDLYIIDWMFTLYAKSLPLDVASRVWDVFCRDGEEFLFRTALGVLKLFEDTLLTLDFIHLAQFLTRLPELTSEKLFVCVDRIHMNSDNRKFKEVLASHRETRET